MFKASLDKMAQVIPALMVLLSFGMLTLPYFTNDKTFELITIFPTLLILVIVFFSYLYSPQGYEINLDSIAVVRKMGKFFISRKDIASIRTLSESELGGVWRMAGNGGVFGYTGWFSSGKIGKMRWFVTQRKNYILIELNSGKKILLSPDDVGGFMESMK